MEVVVAGRPGCRGDHPATDGPSALIMLLLAVLTWPTHGSLFCLYVPEGASGIVRDARFVFCYVFSPNSPCVLHTPLLGYAHIFCLLSVLFFYGLCSGAAPVLSPLRLSVAGVAGFAVVVAPHVPSVAAYHRSMSSTAYNTHAASPLSSET